jgi:hypothetical protein
VADAASQAAIDADEAWRAALAALYEMTRDDAPPHAVVSREEAPERLMDHYGFKALTSLGDERDLRWFLPRLVELLAVDPSRIADPRIVADKTVMAGFHTWPEEERATVRAAFLALWRLWLDGGRPWRRPWHEPLSGRVLGPDEILPGVAALGIDIGPLLDDFAIRAHDDRALAEEYVDYAELVAYYQLDDADDPYDVGGRAALRYFRTDSAIARVDALATRYAGDPRDVGERLGMVAGHIRRHRGG